MEDLDRSVKFYRYGLGLSAHNYKLGDEIVFFNLEGTWLSLFSRIKLAEDANVSVEGHGFRAVTLAHNVSSVDEVNSVFEMAIKVGAGVVKRPQHVSWGGYSGYFSDPDGHLWEVAYNPYTDLT